MQYDPVSLLKSYGDIYEQRGVNVYGLGAKFPKYAELWAKYVFPNRDKANPSKLRSGLPPHLEDIFNNHYGVFYHLMFTFAQLHQFSSQIIDIATPLYHLSTAIDLAEKTFFAALLAKGAVTIDKLDENDYAEKTRKYWTDQYEGGFKAFTERNIPVNIPLHSIRKIVEQATPDLKKYNGELRKAQEYRNALTHNLFPLKLIIEERVYIPKVDKLKKYRAGRWSSELGSVDRNDYLPAEEVIYTLALDTVKNLNERWQILLQWMTQIDPANEYEIFTRIAGRIPYEESGGIQMGYNGNYKYTASGINFIGDGRMNNDPF